MKASWIWLLIGAAFGGVWFFRSRKPAAAKSTGLPEGAVIGQIGSRIEDSKGSLALADALKESAQSRIVFVRAEGDNYYRNTWSDGRITITDASGTVVLDNPFIPSP